MLLFFNLKGDSKKQKENLSLSPIRVRKSDNYFITIVLRVITIEREIKERSKEIVAKKIKSDNLTMNNRKRLMFLLQDYKEI